MTHPRESLSAYLDGELPEADRRAVEAHLAACAACARGLGELAAIDALARGAPEPASPAGYFDTLPARVRARIRAPRRTIAPAWLLPLAAGIVVAVVAPLVLRENAERGPLATPPAAAVPSPSAVAAAPAAPPAEAKREAAPEADRANLDARRDAPAREEQGVAAQEFAAPPPAARDQAVAEEAAESPPAGIAGGIVGGVVGTPDAATGASTAQAEAGERGRAAPLAVGKAKPAPRAAVAPPAEPLEAADRAFGEAAAIPLTSAEGARRARDAWRRYVRAHPGPEADEARVRLVEAAVAVHRHTGDAADRAAAVREAEAYLADPAPPQAERVRAAVRRLDEPRRR